MSRPASRSSFLKSALALISGTVLSQLIIFLFSPFLSRIFAVTDFGNLANYSAWVSILALASCLRYEHAIIVAHDLESTNSVVALTAVLSAISSVAYALIGVVIYLSAATGYLHEIRGTVLFIPIGVLFICVSSALIQLHVKAGRFRKVAIVVVAQMLVTVSCQITFGLLGVEHGLIIGVIAGSAFASAMLSQLLFLGGRLGQVWRAITLRQLRATAREYVDFPRFALAADAVVVVVQQFTPVFILALFSPALAGVYAFAIRIVRVPLIVVSTAVSSVLRKEGVDHLNREGNLRSLFGTIVRNLFVIGAVPFVVVLLFGDRLFSVVFGAQWVDAGRVVQILSPGILLEFVAFPLAVFFTITRSQRYTLRIQLIGFGLLLMALVIGKYYLDDFMATCYLISGVMVIVNLASIIVTARVAGRSLPQRAETVVATAEALLHVNSTGAQP